MILHFTDCKPHLPTMAAGGRTERCWLQLPEGSEGAWAWRWLGWKNGEAVVCRLYSLPSYPRENCAHSFLLRVQCSQTRTGRLPRIGRRLSSLLLSSQRPGDSEHAGNLVQYPGTAELWRRERGHSDHLRDHPCPFQASRSLRFHFSLSLFQPLSPHPTHPVSISTVQSSFFILLIFPSTTRPGLPGNFPSY